MNTLYRAVLLLNKHRATLMLAARLLKTFWSFGSSIDSQGGLLLVDFSTFGRWELAQMMGGEEMKL